MNLKVRKLCDVGTPSVAHAGDAGIDLYSPNDFVLEPWSRKKVWLGVQVAIPENHFGLMMPRSSMFARGIHVGLGVVDSGYRGDLHTVLENLNDEQVQFSKGDRIAQMLIVPFTATEISVTDSLDNTERGVGGFGSSGA